jgi:hypothetical protein
MMSQRLIAIATAMLLAGTSAHAADYRLTIAFDRTNPATPLIGVAFAKHLETASKGRMKVQVTGPETVPSFEQLQPVAAIDRTSLGPSARGSESSHARTHRRPRTIGGSP